MKEQMALSDKRKQVYFLRKEAGMYYIVNYGHGLEVGWTAKTPHESAIGPYFSYKEAMAVLHHWSK